MVEVRLLDRLRAIAQRKRWTIGLRAGGRCRRLDVALVGSEGRGLASRAEVFAAGRLRLSREIRRAFARLGGGRKATAGEGALLAAQLAESQAALLDEFAAQIAPVWDRVLAVAVDDPGLWGRAGGLTGCFALCDAARLAELSGQNVIDAFASRDLAQDGRGRPLLPIPQWMLLGDLQSTRVLIEWGRRAQVTYLPASRDASGASRVLSFSVPRPDGAPESHAEFVEAIVRSMAAKLPAVPRIDELVVCGPARHVGAILSELAVQVPHARTLQLTELGIPRGALRPAAVALLGLLHLDQVPGGATAITGARVPRVLGRLTPGSLASWHRLVRELAAAKPSVVSLRSAV
jgi:1,6-anhydro-N-acetylmuramate kinase